MGEQIECLYTSEDGNLAYLLHLPSGYNHAGNDRWPLLVFLHGWGESGDDLQLLKYHWVPKHLDTAASIPFVVVAPQAPEGVEWQELTELLLAFIRAATLKYRVNPDQICLTGLSTGGKGVWALAVKHPEMFAAVAPVSGDIPEVEGFMDSVLNLRKVPVWVVHGDRDDVYPAEQTESIVNRLKAVQGNVKYTVIPDAGHVAWEDFYSGPALYEWMLEQVRPRR